MKPLRFFLLALTTSLVLSAGNLSAQSPPSSQTRPASNDEELRYWRENMVWYHRWTNEEVSQVTGLSPDLLSAKLADLKISPETAPAIPKDRIFLLPYPGGRHPRIGFLDGAVDPQRETKISVFTPWQRSPDRRSSGDFVVVDVPEAIWSNLGLTYLAHTHIDTVWTKQNIRLEQLEWSRHDHGILSIRRRLPNGIEFTTLIVPRSDHVEMQLTLTNGSDRELTDLRVQNCVMLKNAHGFDQQTNDNKVLSDPFIACGNSARDKWIITAWLPNHRTWANPPCPCLHSDPKFPDCKPGQTKSLRGWLSFYEGTDVRAEFTRIAKLDWDKAPLTDLNKK